MARPWSRKRRDANPEPDEDTSASSDVGLDDADHAWWAQTDVERVWTPKVRSTVAEPEAEPERERDILAEHFGDDWRTSFGFTGPTEEELAEAEAREQQALADQDPYQVLEVEPTATWEEIVAAHRHQARVHHPDRLFGQSDGEKERSEDRIRVINAAYQELRVRRGK
jgi:hypothetical protein